MSAAELFIEALSNAPKAQAGARLMVLKPDLSTEEIDILRGLLVPWWDTERDARVLCRYLGAIGSTQAKGSATHRRAVMIAERCARSALPMVRKESRAETLQILDKLAAWACGDMGKINVSSLQSRAWAIWSASSQSDEADACYAVVDAVRSADNIVNGACPDQAANAVADQAVAAGVVRFGRRDTPEWTEAKSRHLSDLADMIRAEIPVCPVGLP